jgi:hypothetical protein
MPRDGAFILSDVLRPRLSIVCEPCRRHETYNVARLIKRQGDAKMTDLLQTLANGPKARSANIDDRCRAVFERLALQSSWTKSAPALAHFSRRDRSAKSAYRGLGKSDANPP